MRANEFILEYASDLDENQLPAVLNLIDAEKLLSNAGYRPARCAGSHQTWVNPNISGKDQSFPLPRHHTISPGVTRKLYKLLKMK